MSGEARVLNGRYRLDRIAGRGGFASVYRGTDLVLRRNVAIKVLKPELVAADQRGAAHFLDRFAHEARAVAALDHPHVLAVYDYGLVPGDVQTPPTAFLVMPYVDGGSLYERLKREPGGRLPPPLVARYLDQLAQALDYAHGQGIVHRDVKPQNALLRGDDRVLLTDFGIATLLDGASSEQSHNGVVGTFGYMAPEQLNGRSGPGSDVYALGCVVFQLLTGQLPFPGSVSQIVHGHLYQPVPSVVERGGGYLSPAVQRVLDRALAKRPEERFASAGELAAAFALTCSPEGRPIVGTVAPRVAAPPTASGVWAVPASAPTGQTGPTGPLPSGLAGAPASVAAVAAPRRAWGLPAMIGVLLVALAVLVGTIAWLRREVPATSGVPLTPKLVLAATLDGHRDKVRRAAWSPDGARLATAAMDGVVRVWTAEGQLLQSFEGHEGAVIGVGWSPDGRRLVSGSDDQTVRLWTIEGGAVQVLTGHTDRVRAVAWSPDGKLIASASNDRTVRLWGAEGQPVRTLTGHTDFVTGLAWSSDSKLLASSSYDRTIRLWTPEGNLVQPLVGHENYVLGLSWSPDNKALVSASGDTTVRLWYLDGRATVVLKGHQAPVIDVAWSPTGERIASASADGTVRIWATNETLLQTLTGHGDWVNSVAWTRDGQRLVSAANDTTVRVWR